MTFYSWWFLTFTSITPPYTIVFLTSNLSDQDAAHLHITIQEKSDLIEEVLTEVSVYLGMLYHLIEVFKGHDDFADELSQSFLQGFIPNATTLRCSHSIPFSVHMQ